jgi:hypothetical protein
MLESGSGRGTSPAVILQFNQLAVFQSDLHRDQQVVSMALSNALTSWQCPPPPPPPPPHHHHHSLTTTTATTTTTRSTIVKGGQRWWQEWGSDDPIVDAVT